MSVLKEEPTLKVVTARDPRLRWGLRLRCRVSSVVETIWCDVGSVRAGTVGEQDQGRVDAAILSLVVFVLIHIGGVVAYVVTSRGVGVRVWLPAEGAGAEVECFSCQARIHFDMHRWWNS